ncbi:hypothetical protein JRO89_XS13G0028300 [Xanthoceras sorbifolium]|uniref:Uncharacterized protein n=1 Tax=Xanthoceras sorbifolium TaxID=99658 RepID=A0ABQ8H687_9ROSI|nr:hypothetical protein JRO89_XS13G0028300 [Xanthoceras sorbifolium]
MMEEEGLGVSSSLYIYTLRYRHVDLRANTSKHFIYSFIKKKASKKCSIAWAIFLVFVLFLTSQVTARALPCPHRSGAQGSHPCGPGSSDRESRPQSRSKVHGSLPGHAHGNFVRPPPLRG